MKTPMRAIVWRSFAILMLGSVVDDATAQSALRAKELTKGEWALVPEWCIDSQDGPYGGPDYGGMNKSPRAPKWVSLMGSDFWHMHHYCRGLRDILRLKQAGLSGPDRTFLIGRAIAEFEYVLGNCHPNMPLLPEVLLKKGEMHLLQQDLANAQFAFEQARKLRPDYWPAYDRWIVELVKLKRYDTARALAEEGLIHSPGEPTLTAHLTSIKQAASLTAAAPRNTRTARTAAASASR